MESIGSALNRKQQKPKNVDPNFICTASVIDGKTTFCEVSLEWFLELMDVDSTEKPMCTQREHEFVYRFLCRDGSLSEAYVLDPKEQKCYFQVPAGTNYFSSDRWQVWFPIPDLN